MTRFMISMMESHNREKLDKFESDLKRWCEAAGTDVVELFAIPLPPGHIREGPKNVLIREEFFADDSLLPLLKKEFKEFAWNVLKEEILRCHNKNGDWKVRVARRANEILMKSNDWSCYGFLPMGQEIWIATPSHPGPWVDQWGGPWGLHTDGISFFWNFTGIFLQPAFTLTYET